MRNPFLAAAWAAEGAAIDERRQALIDLVADSEATPVDFAAEDDE